MRLSPFVIASLLIVSACAAPSIQPDEDPNHSSSAMSSSTSSAKFDLATHSGTYVNEEYGFSLTYPAHFEPLKPTTTLMKNQGAYIEDNTLKFKELIPSLITLKSGDRDIQAMFSLYVTAFPLKGYSEESIYSDEYEYAYDDVTNAWKGTKTGAPFQPETRKIGGKTAYRFEFGDAGSYSDMYAIPLPEKNVMLEFTLSSCVSCTDEGPGGLSDNMPLINENEAHVGKETNDILNSIRFQ